MAADKSMLATSGSLIEPPTRWGGAELGELWRYRELFITLAARDLRVRYKQTEFGIAWAIIQPLFSMVVFTFVFGRLAGFSKDTGGIPYPIVTYAALVPWTYFSNGLTRAANSMVVNVNLITKVYFPRLIIPMSSLASGLVDLAVAFAVLVAMMVFYRIVPGLNVLLLPVFVLLATGCALGLGLWLAALNVEYRDVGYVVPFLLQAWMWLTPVAYPLSSVPEKWQTLYAFNPMVAVIEGFRWALLGSTFPWESLVLSTLFVVVLLITGLLYFRRMESTFADVV